MKDSLKYLKDDVADIMRRHYDRIEDVHAETRRELESLINKAYFDGYEEGVDERFDRASSVTKGEAA